MNYNWGDQGGRNHEVYALELWGISELPYGNFGNNSG